MGTNVRQVTRTATSSTGASVYSEPVHVGGQEFSAKCYGPNADLIDIEVSEDNSAWVSGTLKSDGTTALETLDTERVEVFERPMWARFEVRTDAAGPDPFVVVFSIRREDH